MKTFNIFPDTKLEWIIALILIVAYAILVVETFRKRGIRSQSFFTNILWAIIDLIVFIFATEEKSDSLFLVFGCIAFSTFLSLLLFKYDKEKKWTQNETRSSIIITIVIIVWLFSRSNSLGLVLAVIAEIFAGWPQMKRSWRNPGTRLTLLSYILFVIGYLLSVISSSSGWELKNVIFPLAFFIYCVADTIPLIKKWWKILKRSASIKKCAS